jgi:hypothetical protein
MEDPDEDPSVTLCSGEVGGVTYCTVPNVVGMTQTDANIAIDACGLDLGTVTEECNDVVADGLVLRSTPVGGTSVTCGSAVDIVLSKNPPLAGAATLTSPAANAICVAPNPTLTWVVGAGTDTQDVRFGTTNPPPVVSAGVPAGTTTYVATTSNYMKYYWTVDEKNECGEVTAGTVQCFLTGPNAGKPCCTSDPNSNKCLGDVDSSNVVRTSDISALSTFLSNLGSPYRCTTAVGSATCPPCNDIDGNGTVRTSDISALSSLLTSFGSPYRKTCQWLSCP